MPKDKLNLETLGKSLKLPLGPITSPNPGPTFDIAEAAPDSAVIKSNPFRDMIAAKIKKIKKYRNIKPIIEYIKGSLIFLSLYFMGNTPFG